MIKLQAFLDDKNAGKALHVLEGLVIQMTMVPVKNAIAQGNKIVGAGGPETAGEAARMAINAAIKNKQKEITTTDIIKCGETYGFRKAGIMGAIGALKTKKLLKKKARGIYTINNTQGV